MSVRTKFVTAFVLAIVFSLAANSESYAGGNSGWGWAKPLNKRVGLLYTTNRNANPIGGSRQNRTLMRSSNRTWTTSSSNNRIFRSASTQNRSNFTTKQSTTNDAPMFVPIPRPYPLRALQPYHPFGF